MSTEKTEVEEARIYQRRTTGRKASDIEVAAHEFVETMVDRADVRNPFPLWHGWALRDAFLAGWNLRAYQQNKQKGGEHYVTVHVGCLDWDLSEARRHLARVNDDKDATGYIKGFREGNVTGIEHSIRLLKKWKSKESSHSTATVEAPSPQIPATVEAEVSRRKDELLQAIETSCNHDEDDTNPPVDEHDCFCIRCCAIRLLSAAPEAGERTKEKQDV